MLGSLATFYFKINFETESFGYLRWTVEWSVLRLLYCMETTNMHPCSEKMWSRSSSVRSFHWQNHFFYSTASLVLLAWSWEPSLDHTNVPSTIMHAQLLSPWPSWDSIGCSPQAEWVNVFFLLNVQHEHKKVLETNRFVFWTKQRWSGHSIPASVIVSHEWSRMWVNIYCMQ